MNITRLIFLFLFSCMGFMGYAQTSEIDARPYIEVTGTAEKEIVPDEIYIGISIHERYVNKIKVTIEEQETNLKNMVKSLSIDLKNLSLSDADADYIRVRWQKKDVMTKKNYTLKVSDVATLNKVFEGLEKLEITDASIDRVSHSKIDELRKEVRILAIKAAKEKAEYLTAAIGSSIGIPLVINEIPQNGIYNINKYNLNSNIISNETYQNYGGAELPETIQFENIKLTASIYIKYLIK